MKKSTNSKQINVTVSKTEHKQLTEQGRELNVKAGPFALMIIKDHLASGRKIVKTIESVEA